MIVQPIPILLYLLNLVDEKDSNVEKVLEEAKSIVRTAEHKHRKALEEFNNRWRQINERLQSLGNKKLEYVTQTAQILVKLIDNARARAEVSELVLDDGLIEDIKEISRLKDIHGQIKSLELIVNAGHAISSAALGAYAIYGTADSLALASEVTPIAFLSDAAVTEATLSWLGRGALATGSLGAALGKWVPGGLVVALASAIIGFTLASKAEEALTKAEECAAEVEQKFAEMKKAQVIVDALEARIEEVERTLDRLMHAFNRLKDRYFAIPEDTFNAEWTRKTLSQEELYRALEKLIQLYLAIKQVVETPLLDNDGRPVEGIRERCRQIVEILRESRGRSDMNPDLFFSSLEDVEPDDTKRFSSAVGDLLSIFEALFKEDLENCEKWEQQ